MKLALAAAAILAGMTVAAPAFAESSANCESMWSKLDTSNQGSISGAAAKPYLDAMNASASGSSGSTTSSGSSSTTGTTTMSDSLTKQDFMAQCQNDAFKNVPKM